jgi:hypothetical protein
MDGVVDVSVTENTDPLRVGSVPAATGFPMCRATVEFEGRGYRPELFDAPYRSDRSLSLDWRAHSFLCMAPSSPFAKEVEAVVGFSWGFRMDDGNIEIVEPAPLSRDDWSNQLDLLSAAYPAWDFTADTDWPVA